MKALSVKQPWAGYIACGSKTIETRTWETKYRGLVLICASQKPEKFGPEYFHPEVTKITGKALCVAEIVDCVPLEKKHEEKAFCRAYDGYAWMLENIRPIAPFPVKGQLGLFNVPEEIVNQIKYL